MARKAHGQPRRSAVDSPAQKQGAPENLNKGGDTLVDRRIWSAAETQAHEASVEAWLTQGATFTAIEQSLMGQVPGMSKYRAMKLVRRVFERWRQEDMERREHALGADPPRVRSPQQGAQAEVSSAHGG